MLSIEDLLDETAERREAPLSNQARVLMAAVVLPGLVADLHKPIATMLAGETRELSSAPLFREWCDDRLKTLKQIQAKLEQLRGE